MSVIKNYAIGRHYSDFTGASSGRSQYKRQQTKTKTQKFHRDISIGSINTTTTKDPMKLAQCILQCKALKVGLHVRFYTRFGRDNLVAGRFARQNRTCKQCAIGRLEH